MISTEKKSDSAMWNSAALIFCGGVHSSRATGEQLLYFLTGHISMTLLATVALLTLKRMPPYHSPRSLLQSVGAASLVYRLRRPAREWQSRGSIPALSVGFLPGSSHTSDFQIGTPVATLQDAWQYRVSDGTSWPGVSIL